MPYGCPRHPRKGASMKKLLCWIFGHRNTISCVLDGKVTHDRCERCGADLPIAYPHHQAREQDPMPLFDDWPGGWKK